MDVCVETQLFTVKHNFLVESVQNHHINTLVQKETHKRNLMCPKMAMQFQKVAQKVTHWTQKAKSVQNRPIH